MAKPIAVPAFFFGGNKFGNRLFVPFECQQRICSATRASDICAMISSVGMSGNRAKVMLCSGLVVISGLIPVDSAANIRPINRSYVKGMHPNRFNRYVTPAPSGASLTKSDFAGFPEVS